MRREGKRELNSMAAPILLGLCAGFASLRHERFAHLLWHDFGCPPAAQEHVNAKGQEHAGTRAWATGHQASKLEGTPPGGLRRVGVLRHSRFAHLLWHDFGDRPQET